MADREKVIAGLECCSRSKLMDKCHECPYFSSCGTEGGSFAEIAHDALALLKAQEPQTMAPEAEWLLFKGKRGATCSYCKHTYYDVYDVENYDYYCRHCGAKMVKIRTVK